MAGSSPDDASSGKCFSGILSRILCSRSLPTHPSDQLPDPDPKSSYHLRQESSVKSDHHHHQLNNGRAITNTPGVVARLMGLESMPDLMGPKSRPFGSFLRSKSVNFIDFLPQIGLTTGEAQHRRVRTSVSFREAIGFDREKNDFFVVCFDSPPPPPPPQTAAASFQEVKKAKQRSVVKKTKQRSVEVSVPDKTRRNDVSRKGNLDLKEKRAVEKPADSRRVCIESKPVKKKKSRCHVGSNKIQPEYASILDHPKTSSPTKSENCRKLQKCSKKELPHKSRNAGQQHRRRVDNKAFINEQTTKTVEENVCRPRKKEVAAGSNENTLLEICKFAEESAISEYWWVGGGLFKFEDSEEICMHFGQQILDGLVNDVVGELVKIHESRI